jgi:hypothetical protein
MVERTDKSSVMHLEKREQFAVNLRKQKKEKMLAKKR